MKLLLIDGSNLIFRAYYATEKNILKNPVGEPVNALYTIISMIEKLKNDIRADHMFIAMDSGKSTFRHKMYDDYKGKRISIPEKLKSQFSLIEEYFKVAKIKFFSTDEYEADDLIATYARKYSKKDIEIQVVSGDKDLLQLVDEKIRVLTPKIGFSKEINYDISTFYEKYTFKPDRFIEYKALVGDSSDNIMGVNKLGDKTAKKLINEYNSLDKILKAASNKEIKGKLGENIANSIDDVKNNITLVTLIDTVSLKYDLDELLIETPDTKIYCDFLKKQGFLKLYDKFLKTNGVGEIEDRHHEKKLEYKVIDSFDSKEHCDDFTYIYTQSLEENYFLSENLGIAIVSKKGNFYLPVDKINNEFFEFLKSNEKKVIYNVKRFLTAFEIKDVKNVVFDPYLALSLLNSENFSKPFDVVFNQYQIYYVRAFDAVYGPKRNPKIKSMQLVQEDLISKAYAIYETHSRIAEEILENDLSNVLDNIEIPLSFILSEMELNGVQIDQNNLEGLTLEYKKKQEKKLEEINLFTEININSTSQLSDFLFEEIKLPKKGLKKTKKGFSTDVENLEKLLLLLREKENNYEQEIKFITDILEYRKITKILSTYLLSLPRFILKDKKVHPINNQLLSETGRLSVMDPNIQNMPITSNDGQKIRALFKPSNGNKLIAFDYSQIELRIMASFSKDQQMINDFNTGHDIHTETARRMFNLEEVSPSDRSKAKAINFGIIYGISSYGLAKQVNISNAEAQEFINTYFETYPKVKDYMDLLIEKVEQNGYVTTFSGRRRIIEGINSKNFNERNQAKRMAINTPIQGTGADILKLALIQVGEKLKKNHLKSKMIMQIHDEIILDVPENEIDTVVQIVKDTMENIVDLPVQLEVDYGIGINWLETK